MHVDQFDSIRCPTSEPSSESTFASAHLACGLHRSSLIHLYYFSHSHPVLPGQSLAENQIQISPRVQFNEPYLSQLPFQSFVLLHFDPAFLPRTIHKILLIWIRYVSLSTDHAYDLCTYQSLPSAQIDDQQRLVLLYATNASERSIRANTYCYRFPEWFPLISYVHRIRLELIGATHFIIPHVDSSDDSWADDNDDDDGAMRREQI